MDLQVIRNLSILTFIWSLLFISIILTTLLSQSALSIYPWIIYSIIIGLTFAILKHWNKARQEPLLDVNLTHTETAISVSLAVLVALFGGALFQLDKLWHELWQRILLSYAMTSSQFSLLKSVQPDPASPTHGFNRIVLLSRPIYFCLLSTVLLICENYVKSTSNNDDPSQRPTLVFYSFDIFDKKVVDTIGHLSFLFILAFPMIFFLGLLPQITTFIIYVLEQIDMHLFGATAATLGIRSAVYSITRSVLAIAILYLVSLQTVGNQRSFSILCGLLISFAYFLSRNSSDATIAYRIFLRAFRSLNPSKQFGEPEKIELQELRATTGESVVINDPLPQSSNGEDATDIRIPAENPEKLNDLTEASSSSTSSTSTSTVSSSSSEYDDSTAAVNSQETSTSVAVPNPVASPDSPNETTVIDASPINTSVPTEAIEEAVTSANNASTSNNSNPNNNISSTLVRSVGNTLERDEKESDCCSITTKIQSTIDEVCISRMKRDIVRCLSATVLVFALHITSIFNHYHDQIEKYVGALAVLWGITFHFIVPQLRRDIPCICLAKPVLRPREYNFFEVKSNAKMMWFERIHKVAISIEKNIIYPIFWLNVISHDAIAARELFGQHIGPLILVIVGFKLVRSSFNDSSPNFITIVFTYLFFNYDLAQKNYRLFSLNYFVFSILHVKIYELLLKLQFIYIYIAPWQIPWGSAFHAFAQPFSVPHSALLFFQAILSSILSAPLQPILGSAIFMMSYVRPTKFWERDYISNVIDINSTRLVTQLERNRIDSNRLDGIFYEHLTKCLQRKLCQDLSLGRWGPVSQGDCFIMASDYLNCLVHIIELGNGLCTFQLRGLEFRGTYCQQQEVEAINEGVPQDDGLCCCEPGRFPYFLSANAAFNQLWLAWHVTHTSYVLEGYSISENAAGPVLQPFDHRRALITYYVKAIIYFTVTSNQLSRWVKTKEFIDALENTNRVDDDLDPTFSMSLDADYDTVVSGLSRGKFCSVYFDWIKYCFERVKTDKKEVNRAKSVADLECSPKSFLVTLCYRLSLLARRSLTAAADGQQFHTVESLLFGLHALLKGDFRVTSLHDEWIFQEMNFFKMVVIPAVRMSLKLHLDHFAAPEDYEDNMFLYEAIAGYQKNLVISHETDVAWRTAVLTGVPSLLTLRLYTDDGSNQYKFIMLNRRYLSFRIIKINRECVRGLWASQQQELIFFRNTDPERGSIQNAKQALRNMINSSCDQPVGYPIYVSPLTTSYVECSVLSSFTL